MSYPWGSLTGCQGRRSQLGAGHTLVDAAAAPAAAAGGRAAEAGAADPSNVAAAGASDAPTALASVPAAGASVEAATHALVAALGLSPRRSATLASVFGTLRPAGGGAAPPRAPPPLLLPSRRCFQLRSIACACGTSKVHICAPLVVAGSGYPPSQAPPPPPPPYWMACTYGLRGS